MLRGLVLLAFFGLPLLVCVAEDEPAAQACRCVNAQGAPDLFVDSPTALWNCQDEARIRQAASAAIRSAVESVTDKKRTPASGSRHDYMSMGPYWWPNPNTTNGLPYVRRDGEVNPESKEDSDEIRVGRLVRTVETLSAAAWRLGDADSGREAVRRLRVFFLDPETAMNPNLEFGQAIPGVCGGRGIGIIGTYVLAQTLIDSIRILSFTGALGESDEGGLKAWFASYLDWLCSSRIGRDEAAAQNNHGTAYDFQCAVFSLFVGREDRAREILAATPARRICPQIEPDGRMPRELARSRPLHYSTYCVGMFCELAVLGRRLGVDLWGYEHPDGRSIRKAVDYLRPFWHGRKMERQDIVPVFKGIEYRCETYAARLSKKM